MAFRDHRRVLGLRAHVLLANHLGSWSHIESVFEELVGLLSEFGVMMYLSLGALLLYNLFRPVIVELLGRGLGLRHRGDLEVRARIGHMEDL